MRKFSYSTLVLALLLPTTTVLAQQKKGDMKPMDSAMKSSAEARATHKATGVVKKVDSKTGVVTLAHEAVNSMNWPPMTMGFMVNDKILLDKFPVGKRVNFEFVQDANGYVVTSVK